MSTLQVGTIKNASGVEVYTAKAWVNFNGTGTVAIRASGNVSSITDNGTGDYTVNFTTAFADANYSAVAMAGPQNTTNGNQTWLSGSANTNPTTALYRLQSQSMGATGATYTFTDASFVNAVFFR
jgi:hypothetical protein